MMKTSSLTAGDFLGLDALDAAHAVRGINDVIADREFQTALAHSFVLNKFGQSPKHHVSKASKGRPKRR
jgi:hypothetical protein